VAGRREGLWKGTEIKHLKKERDVVGSKVSFYDYDLTL